VNAVTKKLLLEVLTKGDADI